MDIDEKLRQNQRIEKVTKMMGNYLLENVTEKNWNIQPMSRPGNSEVREAQGQSMDSAEIIW